MGYYSPLDRRMLMATITLRGNSEFTTTADIRVVRVANQFDECKVEFEPVVPAISLEPSASEFQLVLKGRKIDAIKSYRARTGVGLKDAKDAIDKLDPNYITPGPIGY